MEVHVVRHTKVAVATGICYGQSEVPLADTFYDDARRLKDQLPADFDAVYTSTLSRCRRLAEELAFRAYIQDERLRELHFGAWEMRRWEHISTEKVNEWSYDIVNVSPPGGESVAELFSRVGEFIDDLIATDKNKVLIVTHAGVIRCFWAYVLQFPLKNLFRLPVGFGEVYVFSMSKQHEKMSIIRKS